MGSLNNLRMTQRDYSELWYLDGKMRYKSGISRRSRSMEVGPSVVGSGSAMVDSFGGSGVVSTSFLDEVAVGENRNFFH